MSITLCAAYPRIGRAAHVDQYEQREVAARRARHEVQAIVVREVRTAVAVGVDEGVDVDVFPVGLCAKQGAAQAQRLEAPPHVCERRAVPRQRGVDPLSRTRDRRQHVHARRLFGISANRDVPFGISGAVRPSRRQRA